MSLKKKTKKNLEEPFHVDRIFEIQPFIIYGWDTRVL